MLSPAEIDALIAKETFRRNVYNLIAHGASRILDFGCVKIFDVAFIEAFTAMVKARMTGDEEGLKDAMVALGLVSDRGNAQELADMARIAEYFSAGLQKDEPFDFAEYSYVHGAKELVTYFLQQRRVPPSQRNMIFMTRVVLGYYEYFSRARAKMNFRQMVWRWIKDDWTGRAITIPPYGE